ncbi:MAG: sigma-54-dependent Fis family transcriptional regulator [Desulfobacterium sp.]|nr:sigma-54-dependent Fis family transcriptional regulator [Desulfobacterium sp.]
MKKERLSSEERGFFRMVYHAAFANPFSELREKLDRKIAGHFPGLSKSESGDRYIREIDMRIRRLEKEGRGHLDSFSGQDRSIIKIVFLFDLFYKFRDRFDRLIVDQIKAGDESVPVVFADEAMAIIRRRGIPEETILHYFAFSYQLRRAFFFISHSLVGNSQCMKTLRRNLWNNVFTHNIDLYDRYLWNRMEDFSTLILGETGTGKGTAAMAMGRSGYIPFDLKKRRFSVSFTRAFSSLNLSQFPEALLESELFGHKKGAFTGAVEDYQGVFDRCSPHGSILLDEIGEVADHVQVKLLQVLQERFFTPVGSHSQSRFQGRVIAATNRSVSAILNGEVFRDDFYYRLCSDIIEVPPLRERISQDPTELDDLLEFTVKRMAGSASGELTTRVKRVINKELGPDYRWPGNVRELEQCVRRVMMRKSYEGREQAGKKDLGERLAQGIKAGNMAVSSLIAGYCTLLYREHNTYEQVAKRTGLDRRTVKKYIDGFKDNVA